MKRQHNYYPPKKSCHNPFITSKFGCEYFKVQCSCGLFGVGRTAVEAMEHLNKLHETVVKKPTLLFIDLDMVCSQLNELDSAA